MITVVNKNKIEFIKDQHGQHLEEQFMQIMNIVMEFVNHYFNFQKFIHK